MGSPWPAALGSSSGEIPEHFEILVVENPRPSEVLSEAVSVAKFLGYLVADPDRGRGGLNGYHLRFGNSWKFITTTENASPRSS